MRKFSLLLVVSVVILAMRVVCARGQPLHLFTDRGEINFGKCASGSTYEETFHLVLRDTHSRWAVFVRAEGSGRGKKVFPYLSLEGPGVTLKKVEQEDRKFLEGTGEGELTVEAKLRFEPDWTIPPGIYSCTLFFQYLPESGVPEDPPLPVVVKVETLPEIELRVEGEGVLRFTAQGSPGLYPLEGIIKLRGRSNAGLWRVVLSSEGLRGEKGGTIPASRIFKKVGKEYLPLSRGFELGPFPGGEEVEITLEGLYVDTVLEDQPDVYQGELRFRCFFKE